MKKICTLVVALLLSVSGFSATWYSDPGGAAVTNLSNWWSNAAGTGTHPASFATAGDVWIIQSVMTIGGVSWSIGGTLQFSTNRLNKTGAAATTIDIGGDLVMASNTRITTGAAAGNITINLSGNLNMSGTSFITNGNTGVSYNYINFVNASSSYAAPQTITWTSTGSSLYTGLTVNPGVYVQLNSNLPLPQNSDVGMTVNGTLICGTNTISSGSTDMFTVNSGATVYTAHASGMSGAITAMSSTALSGGANYVYNGSVAQATGSLLPPVITSGGSVTINNTGAGVSLSQNVLFLSGASLNLTNGSLANTASNLGIASGANVNRDNGTLTVTPSVYGGVNLTYKDLGNNAGTVVTGNEFPASMTGMVTINKPAATISLNSNKSLTGSITLTAGTLDASTSNYNLTLTGDWTNNAAAAAFTAQGGQVAFSGSAAQNIGGTFPSAFNDMVVNNAAGVSLGTDEQVNGTLFLLLGNVAIGTHNFVFGPSALPVAGSPSATSMIISNTGGQVRKLMNANGTFVYPIGDDALNYTPITLAFTGGTYNAGAYTAVSVTNMKQPANANVTDYLNRYWSVTTSAITAPAWSVTEAVYVPSDVTGAEGNIAAGAYTGSLPWLKYGLASSSAHSLTVPGLLNVAADISGITATGPSVIASPDVVLCSGIGTATLSATTTSGDPSFTYTWSPAEGLSATTGATVFATPTITTTYMLTVTDGNGFTASAPVTVSVNPTPTAIAGTLLFCQGTTSSLSSTPTGGTWSSSAGAVAPIDISTGVATGAGPGMSDITYTAGGCSVSTTVTVGAAPGAIIGPSHVCPGNTITLANSTSSGVWSSSLPATASVDASAGIVSGIASGVVTISYTTTGCNPVTYAVTVDPAPAPITGLYAVCLGNTTSLATTSTGGTWMSSDASVATVGSSTGIVSSVATGTSNITYQFTTTGCYAIAPVSVNPLPAAIAGSGLICASGTATFTDPTPGGTWSSSPASVVTIGSSSGIATGMSVGVGTVTYKVASTGCYATMSVSVNPPPAAITGDNEICNGELSSLADAVSGGVWSSSVPAIAYVNPTTGMVLGMSAGVVVISYSTGCTPATYMLTVDPLPAAISGSLNLCTGATSTLYDGIPGGTWQSSTPSVATIDAASGAASGLFIGTTVITYRLPTGCAITATATVNPIAPIAGTDSVCINATGWVTNIVGGGAWTSSNTAIATVDGVTGFVAAIHDGISYIVYTLPSGCQDSMLLHVLPALPAITGPKHVCTGSAIVLTDATAGGTWATDNAFVADISMAGVVTGHLTDTAHITYTWLYGCATGITITVNPLPTPIVTYNSTANTLATSAFYSSYQWYGVGSGAITGATSSVYVLSDHTDSFYVVVTDTNGCTGRSGKTYYHSVGIDDVAMGDFHIYPNPTTGVLFADVPAGALIAISSADGRRLMEAAGAARIDVSSLSAGIYFVSVYERSGRLMGVQKLVKQ